MDEQKNTNDIKSVQDFEMGASPAPQINRVQPAQVAPAPQPMAVNPSGPAPVAGVPKPPVTSGPVRPPQNPAARKKAMLGCLGAFFGFVIIFLIMSFIFLAQSDNGVSPIAELLGVDQAAFVNSLIVFIHIIFVLFSLTFFVLTMVGLFRTSMAKKDDKEMRKQGLKMTLISGVALILVLIIWGFVYIYLDSKRILTDPELDAAPIVTIPEEPLNLSAPIEVRFDASNIEVDREKYQIVSHAWDFGDGETGTSQIVAHRYTEKGTYDVELVVTVRDKETGEVSVGGEFHTTVSVTNEALAASFTATPQSGEAPLKVKFDASESVDPDGYLERYEWDFDEDGEFDDAEGVDAEHTFNKVGTYEVALRVVSTTGEFNVFEKEIEVKSESGPQAVITISDEPENFIVGKSYVFKGDKSTSEEGSIEEYEWDFGDGSKVEKTRTVSHAFNSEGNFEVVLKVTDDTGEEGETRKMITVGEPQSAPKAVITTAPESIEGALSGSVPFSVAFDASGSTDTDGNIIEYQWDFNDDGKADSFGSKVNHSFDQEGDYTVTLTVNDADGNSTSETVNVTVTAQGVVAVLNADKVDGSAPLTVSFDASSSTYQTGAITSYRWDFGDGTPANLGVAKITHKYSSVGSYTATVTVIGSDNKTSSASIIITVREIPLTACFTTVFKKGPAPLNTSFDPGCSTGSISSYFWDFGDGGTSTQVKPIHSFEEPGEYTVNLEISDNDNNISRFALPIIVTEP